MNDAFLEFEKPLLELKAKIDALVALNDRSGEETGYEIRLEKEITRLRTQQAALTKKLFSQLTPWQTTQVARHPQRPYTLDYIGQIFTEFSLLSGDRVYGDDPAMIGGLAFLESLPVMVIGHQKGRTLKEKVHRNFGMPAPEGYRKALRLMQLAERFGLPIITLIDTPGAYPGVSAEERGQAAAIAENLREMAQLTVPIVCTIIGEGGSGGALAIGVGDTVNMLQYSIYSVISPEGCASILWKSAEKAHLAAEAMGITAQKLQELRLIDHVIPEPLGGAHQAPVEMASTLKAQLLNDVSELLTLSPEALLVRRKRRLREYGAYVEGT